MKKLIFITLFSAVITHTGFTQETIMLTFTAIDSASYVQLDSIKVMNRTQEGDTVLYWNDTVLVLKLGVWLPDINSRKDGFQLRSYPNPLTDHATIEISVPEQGEVKLSVTDILGRQLLEVNRDIHPGTHSFRFIPGNDRLYFLTTTWNGYRRTVKMVNSSKNYGQQCTISHLGYNDVVSTEKAFSASRGFEFSLGDELLYIGYADTLESGLLDSPDTSQTYTFQFAFTIPCPGTPTVTYEGQVYNTVQILGQCWLKENLNAGTMIPGSANMMDNEILEKYCYDDDTANCDVYGGLYQWDEMMQYKTTPGSQGICPPGWHIPTDEEWKMLEGMVDSQYGVGDPDWDELGYRGYDASKKLKSLTGWNGTDYFGFCALPGGYCSNIGNFYKVGSYASYWSSTKHGAIWAWYRELRYNYGVVYRSYYGYWDYGRSIRCTKD